MKIKRKLFSALLAVCLLLTALPVTSLAGTTVTATAATSGSGNKIKLKKVSYDTDDGVKELEVDFSTKVTWKSTAKVSSIKDNKGATYTGYLKDKDNDECDIVIPNLKTGRTYTIKITGIKKRNTTGYRTLTLTVKIPSASNTLTVKDVEYDVDYKNGKAVYTLDFDFNKNVSHKSGSYILIKDSNGKYYSYRSSKIVWDGDDCELRLAKKLTVGKTYTYKIVNVKTTGSSTYTTIEGSFVAYND